MAKKPAIPQWDDLALPPRRIHGCNAEIRGKGKLCAGQMRGKEGCRKHDGAIRNQLSSGNNPTLGLQAEWMHCPGVELLGNLQNPFLKSTGRCSEQRRPECRKRNGRHCLRFRCLLRTGTKQTPLFYQSLLMGGLNDSFL